MKQLCNFLKAPLTKTFVLGLLWAIPASLALKLTFKYLAFYNQYASLIELLPAENRETFIIQTFGQTVTPFELGMFLLGGFLSYLLYKGYITAVTYLTANKNEKGTTFSAAIVPLKTMGLALAKDFLNTLCYILFMLLCGAVLWLIAKATIVASTFISIAFVIAFVVFLTLNSIAASLRFNKTLTASTPFQVRTNFKYLNAHKLRILLSLILLFVWNIVIGWVGQATWALLSKELTQLSLSVNALSIGMVIIDVVALTYLAVLSAIVTGKVIAWIERK